MAAMEDARLKTSIWIGAQIRLCDLQCLPAVVTHHGDEDAGAVLIKIIRSRDDCLVLGRIHGEDGRQIWVQAAGQAPLTESGADAYVASRAQYDPDVWVLEIEDPKGLYVPDGGFA